MNSPSKPDHFGERAGELVGRFMARKPGSAGTREGAAVRLYLKEGRAPSWVGDSRAVARGSPGDAASRRERMVSRRKREKLGSRLTRGCFLREVLGFLADLIAVVTVLRWLL